MTTTKLIDLFITAPARVLGGLETPFLAVLRLWLGWEFFKSGWLKITSWDSTLFLFREEYRVPLLPSDLAAVLGTGGELILPLLIWLGFAGRLSAIGLSALNVVAVVSYAHVLLSEGFEAALAQHYLWALALVALVVFGPGKLSADYFLTNPVMRHRPASASAI